jgi:hypothetical protein
MHSIFLSAPDHRFAAPPRQSALVLSNPAEPARQIVLESANVLRSNNIVLAHQPGRRIVFLLFHYAGMVPLNS